MRFHVPGVPHTVTNKKFISCFSDDTEIMTEDGWRFIKELAENNTHIKVATLNPDSDEVEYHYPEKWIINDYKGKMFHQNSWSVDLLVTPEHRLWVKQTRDKRRIFEFVEARNASRVLQYRKHFPWKEGKEIKQFTLPSYSNHNTKFRPERRFKFDDWLKLFGIYVAEGNIDGTSYLHKDGTYVKGCHVVCIAQEKSESRELIEQWIKELGIDYIQDYRGFRICDVQIAHWFKQFGTARTKFIPKEWKNLSKRQLQILLDALVLGDGWKVGNCIRYVSFSKQLADDVGEIAIKLGYRVCQYDDPNPDVPRHILTITKNKINPTLNWHKDDREWVDYEGKVYCLVVKNHLIYIRRHGKCVFIGQCAYTQKVVKLCEMLMNLGHTVYHYGCEGSDPKCTEHVDVTTDAYRQKFYPDQFKTEQFRFDTADEFHQNFHKNCIEQIRKRMQPKDFLLCAWGWGHQPTASQLPELMVVESGIGYPDVFAKYKVFESYTWMQYVYGKDRIGDGSWYDTVVPNYFDTRDFQFSDKKEDYFLYIGRLVKRKGVELAAQVTEKMGKKLVIAGQGKLTDPAEGIDLNLPHVEFAGFADVNKRKELMAKAKAVFVPTYYVEPFGGVSIEAMLSGTPVITTDWGVFSETVLQGVTGYRCRTFDHFCWAVENIDKCSPKACYEWAKTNYSMERVGLMYQEYFEILYDLWEGGWYARHPERKNLDWNRRWFPIEATVMDQPQTPVVAKPDVVVSMPAAPSPGAPMPTASIRGRRDWME